MWERSGHKSGAVRVPEVHKEQRYIFNGEPSAAVSGYAVRQNRRSVTRRISTFNIILALFVLGIVIVAYIDNIIVVNRLVVDCNALQGRYQRLSETNATLQAEVNRKTSLERIGKLATESLGMQYPQEQPQWVTVDPDLRDRANSIRRESGK
jgi:cell division protein FtsL